MKKVISLILTLTTVFLSVSLLFSCGGGEEIAKTDEELVIERVNEFLDAYNNGDWEAVMECLEPKVRNQMQALINLIGGVAGGLAGIEIDLRDLFALGVSTVDGNFMNLRIIDCSVGSSTATVTTAMSLNGVTQKIYISLVKEKGEWLISDMSDKKSFYDNVGEDNTSEDISGDENSGGDNGVTDNVGDNSNNDVGGVEPPTNSPDINITSINMLGVLNGNQITFIMDGTEYNGVVNSKGEIYHYRPSEAAYYVGVYGNGGYYYDYSDQGYVIFGQNGKEIAFQANGDFDEIIAWGDGLALVYKNTGNMLNAESSYGIIDVESGIWVKEMTPGVDKKCLNISKGSLTNWSDGAYLAGKYLFVYTDEELVCMEIQGYIAAVEAGKKIYGVELEFKALPDGDVEKFPQYAYIDFASGEAAELPEFDLGSTKILVNRPGWLSDEHISVYNLAEGKSYEYSDVPGDNIVHVVVYEDTVMLRVYGADGKYYIVALDDKAQLKFEPIQCRDGKFDFSEGILIFEQAEGGYCAIDVDGNYIVTADKGYTDFDSFLDGLAVVEKDGEKFYINKEGKRIALKLYAE